MNFLNKDEATVIFFNSLNAHIYIYMFWFNFYSINHINLNEYSFASIGPPVVLMGKALCHIDSDRFIQEDIFYSVSCIVNFNPTVIILNTK